MILNDIMIRKMSDKLPSGVGINFRHEIMNDLLLNLNSFDFIEIITNLFFVTNTIPDAMANLLKIKPCVFHSLKTSLGSAEALDESYIENTINCINKWKPYWFSDHLSYIKISDIDANQLLPIRRNKKNLDLIVEKIKYIKRKTNLPFLIENITYYFNMGDDEFTESEFINNILNETSCGLLLDLNNLYLNSKNHNFDPYQFLSEIDLSYVYEIHIAGGFLRDGLYIDSHAHSISQPVWELLEFTCSEITPNGIVLERDANFDMKDILFTLEKAKNILSSSPYYLDLNNNASWECRI
ncbi:DUF692 family multinuclear iron-containing protein [Photorhabdus heterorhabditis]|uniref:multinuclear nonheme iron-dependent oxidase n=1 Tax=Photorhabdus heterorhabditis TaxID=880156 RepID=UPI0006C8C3EA|nr:DUF692 family multinuclear iron-containing protein [Photorhabdus heterorhabditis]